MALYRDTGYSLDHLIKDIEVGRIALPDIQRPFVWSPSKVRDLFDSMYRGYPIGTIMLWETGADVGTRQIGVDEPDRVPQLLVVDGQQRLTSLFAVMTGRPVLTKDFAERLIRIAFRPSDETFDVTDVAIERDPEFIADISTLWTRGYRATIREFLQRLQAARDEPLSHEEEDRLEERINRVHDLASFRFQVIELDSTADEEQVAEIFVRINSEGVKLKQSDFILTLMSVHWEKGRRALEEFCRTAADKSVTGPSPGNPFIEPTPDQLLRVATSVASRRARLRNVYHLLRGKDLETGEVSPERRAQQFERLASAQAKVLDLGNWHEFLKCLQTAGFRNRSMISSSNAVLFAYTLWLIGRFDFGIDLATLRSVIARWFFMTHTTQRYTGSQESQFEADLSRVSELTAGDGAAFIHELDRIVQATFTPDYWEITLPNRLDSSSTRSPVVSAYLAALTLLDAEALFSDVKLSTLLDPNTVAPRSIERHHLFPRKYLESIGVRDRKRVNSIANLAYVDWPENVRISDSAPLEYWPKLSVVVPEDRLRRQIKLHALPVGWEQLDYDTFLERRRMLMAKVVRDGFATLWGDRKVSHEGAITDLLKAGESQTIEFKSTARWNLHTQQPDPKLEHVIVKTVCGFLNAEGGSLLIGVDDDGNPLGLDRDFETLGMKGNKDGYELFLRQLLDANLSVTTASTVRIRFPVVDGTMICHVSVAASGKPVFAKPPKGGGTEPSDFWVRVGNATKQLHGDDMVDYQTNHWG